MTTAVASNAAKKATIPATTGFGVQLYVPFEPNTTTATLNCISFNANCMDGVL